MMNVNTGYIDIKEVFNYCGEKKHMYVRDSLHTKTSWNVSFFTKVSITNNLQSVDLNYINCNTEYVCVNHFTN